MKKNKLFYDGLFYIQDGNNLTADSMAISGNKIIAVGRRLENDPDFKGYAKYDLKGYTVIPGFTDSHTHFYFMAMTLSNVKLDGLKNIEACLDEIRRHAAKLGRDEWIFGDGFSPDRWEKHVVPDRFMLDKVTGGRPAALFSKDQHVMWVNSRALEMAGYNARTQEPAGGRVDRLGNNEPSGILREIPAYFPILKLYKGPAPSKRAALYKKALVNAYAKGVTGVHSFDGPEALEFFDRLSRENKLGLRIAYYPPAAMIPALRKAKIKFGYGNDYLRVSGVKIFSDGSLGSQTALCFDKYIGSKNNYGVEANPKEVILKHIIDAARLGLPTAIHAIGDKAIANVLDCYEKAPAPASGGRRRIEHLQMIRRSDIKRLKSMGIVASMQPSHCPSDISLIDKYWGKRGRDCFIFNTLLKQNIPLTFGSDVPIEVLDPIAGIDAAVNRKAAGSNNVFYQEERISAEQAVYGFTASPASVIDRGHELGALLPGYFADFVILTDNIFKAPRTKIRNIGIMATFFDGKPVYLSKSTRLSF